VANKGGVREEGAAGWLLAMVQETGGGLVRHDRGAEDEGARSACLREEDEGGAGWLGRPKAKAQWQFGGGGPKEEEGETGWLGRPKAQWPKTGDGPKLKKKFLSNFKLNLGIWLYFGNLHKEI
jgi:hypothetical protein